MDTLEVITGQVKFCKATPRSGPCFDPTGLGESHLNHRKSNCRSYANICASCLMRSWSSLIVLPRIHPMRLSLVREPFDHPDYIFELKHDGFRALVYLQTRECKIISRNQRNLGFESLKKALAKLPVQTAILDGEIVCLDAKGVSQFNQLLSRKGSPSFTHSTFCASMARI